MLISVGSDTVYFYEVNEKGSNRTTGPSEIDKDGYGEKCDDDRQNFSIFIVQHQIDDC